jgi:G:T-mismatch repair DNA endonuclease (very short patch repair protein)
VISELKRSGWRVVTVWECDILKPDFECNLKESLVNTQKVLSQVR